MCYGILVPESLSRRYHHVRVIPDATSRNIARALICSGFVWAYRFSRLNSLDGTITVVLAKFFRGHENRLQLNSMSIIFRLKEKTAKLSNSLPPPFFWYQIFILTQTKFFIENICRKLLISFRFDRSSPFLFLRSCVYLSIKNFFEDIYNLVLGVVMILHQPASNWNRKHCR